MKKILQLLAIAVVLFAAACRKTCTPPPPPVSDVDLKKGLLVYLPFDGNIADSSGNGNPTELIGDGALSYDEHGYDSSAYNGYGNGGAVVVTNNGSIKFDTALSLSFNVMVRQPSRNAMLSFVNRSNAKGASFDIGTNLPGNPHFIVSVNNDQSSCDVNNDAVNVTNDTTSLIPKIESWYNIVVTFHTGTLQVFVNGALESTKTGGSIAIPTCPQAQFVVGGWWIGDPESSLDGRMDEVRMYNRVLNADEIKELSKDFQ